MQKKQPDDTAMLMLIIILVFGVIIMYFGTHSGNSKDENLFNCLLDGGTMESCGN